MFSLTHGSLSLSRMHARTHTCTCTHTHTHTQVYTYQVHHLYIISVHLVATRPLGSQYLYQNAQHTPDVSRKLSHFFYYLRSGKERGETFKPSHRGDFTDSNCCAKISQLHCAATIKDEDILSCVCVGGGGVWVCGKYE